MQKCSFLYDSHIHRPKSHVRLTDPLDNFGTVVGENPDCLLLSGTVVGENPDHVCWAVALKKIQNACIRHLASKYRARCQWQCYQ